MIKLQHKLTICSFTAGIVGKYSFISLMWCVYILDTKSIPTTNHILTFDTVCTFLHLSEKMRYCHIRVRRFELVFATVRICLHVMYFIRRHSSRKVTVSQVINKFVPSHFNIFVPLQISIHIDDEQIRTAASTFFTHQGKVYFSSTNRQAVAPI